MVYLLELFDSLSVLVKQDDSQSKLRMIIYEVGVLSLFFSLPTNPDYRFCQCLSSNISNMCVLIYPFLFAWEKRGVLWSGTLYILLLYIVLYICGSKVSISGHVDIAISDYHYWLQGGWLITSALPLQLGVCPQQVSRPIPQPPGTILDARTVHVWWPCLDPYSNDQHSTVLWLIPVPQLEDISCHVSTTVNSGCPSLPYDARDTEVLAGGWKGEKSLEDSADGPQSQSPFQKRSAWVPRTLVCDNNYPYNVIISYPLCYYYQSLVPYSGKIIKGSNFHCICWYVINRLYSKCKNAKIKPAK